MKKLIFLLILLCLPFFHATSYAQVERKVIPDYSFVGTPSESRIMDHLLEKTSNDLSINRSQRAYGVTDEDLKQLAKNVTQLMLLPAQDHQPSSDNWTSRANSIKKDVNSLIFKIKPDANDLLKERLLIQGLYDWTRTHLVYNIYLDHSSNPTLDREYRKKHWTSDELSKMQNPNAVCIGYSNVLQKMGQALGLECWVTNGAIRIDFSNKRLRIGGPIELIGGHSWVMFKQKDGFILPVDPSRGTVSLSKARELNGDIPVRITLPVTIEDRALYYAVYYSTAMPFKKEFLPSDKTSTTLSYSEWAELDVSPLRASYLKSTWTSLFDTAVVNRSSD